MNILIVGAGRVGFNLAEYFSSLGHQITVVDLDADRCEEVNSKLDVIAINGIGSSPAILTEAGLDNADMLIAVTNDDETNLLVCNFALQCDVKRRIARVRSSAYLDAAPKLSLKATGVTSLIDPERGVVERILQYVELPDVLETANFQDNRIYLRGYRVTKNMPIAGKTIQEVRAMAEGAPMVFVSILRDGNNVPPTGSAKLLVGDEFVAIMAAESFPAFRMLINSKAAKMGKIIVSGNSIIAVHLAGALKPFADKVVLADPDYEHGTLAASLLQGVDVIHGDSTDASVLEEINVKDADCFIAAGEPEENIMACLLAKAEGAKMAIAIRDDDRYSSLFDSIGLDHVINTREITLNSIIERIQTVSIGTYLKLRSTNTEVIRLRVGELSSIVGKSLRQLEKPLKRSAIIGCVIREGEVIIPGGDTSMRCGDEAIIFCGKEQLKRVHKLFNPPVS